MTIDPALLERLAASDDDGFVSALAAAGLDHRGGLEELVDATAEWAWDAPVEAGVVAARSRRRAESAGWSELVPSSRYVEARAALAGGDIDGARSLLLAARAGFEHTGQRARARQTSLGLANVEATAGRFDAARTELTSLITAGTADELGEAAVADRLLGAKARQNLAAIEVMCGRYELAVELLREAEAAYLDHDLRREWIDAVNNRAMALLGLGRTTDAIRAVEVALPQLAADEHRHARAELLDTVARARLVAGDLAAAIDAFRSSLAIAREHGIDERAAATQLGLADVWATLNLPADAGVDYEAVAMWCENNGSAAMGAWATLGWGAALVAQHQVSEGAALLRAAFDDFEGDGQWSGAINAGLNLAAATTDPTARRTLLDRVASHGDVEQRPADQAFIELALFDAGAGAQHLDTAQRIIDRMAVPHLRYEVDVRRARLHRAAGDVQRAATLLRRSVDLINTTRGALASERHRRTYLVDRLAAHTELVRLLIDLGEPEHLREAFEVAEQARSRALLDAMSGFGARRRGSTLDAAGAERLAEFSRELEALYNGLLGDDDLRGLAAVPRDLASLEVHIESLRAELAVLPEPADVVELSTLQSGLAAADAIMLSFHTVGDDVIAFVVGADHLEVRTLPATLRRVASASRRLDAQLARFRAGQAFTERWSGPMLRATTDVLDELGADLLAPLDDVIAGSHRIVVVPTRDLQLVPFAALTSGDGCLLDRVEVIVAPSASAWMHCSERVAATGVPHVIAVADDRAPRVDDEADAVATVLGERTVVLRGDAATRARVLGVEPTSVLHLACHGVFHPHHAIFSALRLGDGWLTAHELADADLAGSLVTVSACESGRTAVQAGDEVIGLARALLMAGARDVIASGWLAHDEATSQLMRRFYGELATGAPPATALRTAQLDVRRRFTHPFYWAAFSVTGCGWQPLPVDAAAPALRSPTTLETV